MVATNLKAELFSLKEQRDAIESQMNVIINHLVQPGGPGISGGLVDSEGFPRADIDIPLVLADRRRLSELRNDYKDITNKIDKNIEVLHSAKLAKNVSIPSRNPDTQVLQSTNAISSVLLGGISEVSPMEMGEGSDLGVPFAMVDQITDGSPAAEDGIQLGDQIVKFGNVENGDELIPRLASEAQLNVDRAVLVVVVRQGVRVILTVRPRQWHGRGLLGCHFRIL